MNSNAPEESRAGKLRGRSRLAAARVRNSRALTACFVFAAYLIATYQEHFLRWAWSLARGEKIRSAPTWRELFTWEGLTSGFFVVTDRLQVFVSQWTVFNLASLATCVVAILWLYSTSLRGALARLGLPRPRRVEFTIPLIAAVPGLVFVVLAYRLEESPLLPDGSPLSVVAALSYGFSTLASNLVGLIPLALVYRGLVEGVAWSRTRAVVALLFLMNVLPLLTEGAIPGDLYSLSLAVWLLGGNFWFLATTWVFEQWQRRLWCLVVLDLGMELTYACLPLSAVIDSDGLIWTIRIGPLALLTLWTLWQARSLDRRGLPQPG